MAFDGRTAIVTGGAGGIGGAVATALARAGARVAVADLDGTGAARRAATIGGIGVEVDVRDEASVRAAFGRAAAELGPLDVVVHAAGVVGGGGPLAELDVAALDEVLAVNVRGTFLVTKAAAAAMAQGGAIVHISSAGAVQPTVGLGHYEASKAAVNALTRAAALELAPRGIRVNAVAPGPVETPLTAAALTTPEAQRFWTARIPLGRVATTADVVPAVLLLASADAAHITGTVLPVEGGQLLKG